MSKSRPDLSGTRKRLAASEPIVDALKAHEVDAVVGEQKIAFLLLKEVREALVNSEAGFRAMFELSGVGMFQADSPAFRFTRVNQKFCDIAGYSAEELLTKTYIGLTILRIVSATWMRWRSAPGQTNSWSIDKRCVRKNGSVISVRVDGAALRDVAGRVVRILAMISDTPAGRKSLRIVRYQIVSKIANKKTFMKRLRASSRTDCHHFDRQL